MVRDNDIGDLDSAGRARVLSDRSRRIGEGNSRRSLVHVRHRHGCSLLRDQRHTSADICRHDRERIGRLRLEVRTRQERNDARSRVDPDQRCITDTGLDRIRHGTVGHGAVGVRRGRRVDRRRCRRVLGHAARPTAGEDRCDVVHVRQSQREYSRDRRAAREA